MSKGKSPAVVPMQTFDVVVAVRIQNAPPVTPEQVERLFDQDLLADVEDYPAARVRTRAIKATAT